MQKLLFIIIRCIAISRRNSDNINIIFHHKNIVLKWVYPNPTLIKGNLHFNLHQFDVRLIVTFVGESKL